MRIERKNLEENFKMLEEKQETTNQGITLIALVVTIVVLLILAGVSITVVFGDNGILQLAKEAGEKTNEAIKNDISSIGELEDILHETQTGIVVEKVKDANPGQLEESEENTYTINSIEDLVVFAYNVTSGNETYAYKTVKLGLSLDFNSTKSYVDANRTDYGEYGYDGNLKTLLTIGEGFKPIGTTNYSDTYTNNIFKGIFDGNGFKIYNLKINKITKKLNSETNERIDIALFPGNDGIIQNLGVCNAKIDVSMLEGRWNTVGIIAGTNFEDSEIKNCYATGQINVSIGTYANIGGLVGSNYGKVSNCYNSADLYCENSNLIAKSVRISSLVGTNEPPGFISNVYNTGDINLKCIKEIPENAGQTEYQIGTVARYVNEDTHMKNGYNIGTLFLEVIDNKAYKYYLSPIVSGGHMAENFCNLKELKYDFLKDNMSNVVWLEGEEDKSSDEMKTAEFVDLLNKDQEAVWTRDENINEGYPIFIWQK